MRRLTIIKRYLKAVNDYLNMDRNHGPLDLEGRFDLLDEYRAAKKGVDQLVREWEYDNKD